MKRLIVLAYIGMYSLLAVSQDLDDTYKEEFVSFQRHVEGEYNNFRDQCNENYAKFVERTWRRFYGLLPKMPPIKDKPVPPMPYNDNNRESIRDKVLPYIDIVPIIPPTPQPQPIVPIKEQPQPISEPFNFSFYGTKGQVRLDDNHRFILSDCSEASIAKTWRWLSGNGRFDNVINDCLQFRMRHGLCDWGYLQMLQELGEQFCGANTNEATLLTAYLYCQSGYKMRLGRGTSGRLYLMVASKHDIYNVAYFRIQGEDYYPMNCEEKELFISEVTFPKEQPLSLWIVQETKLAKKLTDPRTLQSKRYAEAKATLYSNKNLIDFYNNYPTSQIGNDFMTRWAMYANTPLAEEMKESLYPPLRNAIQGKSQHEAANILLNFVQTAFVYEYDDKVWGNDRAFFAEESLYYPYCDCEDRSILFSRLMRDLLGVEVVLVYYPGHLATAVCFTEQVTGDYIQLNGQRFTVCDPTYIGAPVGATMPNMDNQGARVILLK